MSAVSEQTYISIPDNEYLEHYGRLGMKWGKHIFGEERAQKSANRKLQRLDTKAKKASDKAAEYQMKAEEKQAKASSALLFRKSKYKKAAEQFLEKGKLTNGTKR